MRPKSLEQLLFEAYVNHRGLRLTADDVDSLVSDDAVATRISNRACQEAGADEVGEDCIANAICARKDVGPNGVLLCEGSRRCMTNRETWLSTIRANPSDWQAMLVFADWLEESGDLLAAEQWRWIAVVDGSNGNLQAFGETGAGLSIVDEMQVCDEWPDVFANITDRFLLKHEQQFAAENNIRCMPTYPDTIEDVQAYLETA